MNGKTRVHPAAVASVPCILLEPCPPLSETHEVRGSCSWTFVFAGGAPAPAVHPAASSLLAFLYLQLLLGAHCSSCVAEGDGQGSEQVRCTVGLCSQWAWPACACSLLAVPAQEDRCMSEHRLSRCQERHSPAPSGACLCPASAPAQALGFVVI